MATVRITGGDKLAARLQEIAQRLSTGATVEVGYFPDAMYPDGTYVAFVAALSNFGTGKAPPRPFFSNAVVKHSPEWPEQIAKLLKANDMNAAQSLGQMGAVIADEITQSIFDFDSVPNSPVTDLLKQRFPTRDGMTAADVWQAFRDVKNGATAPAGKRLVWSGQMARSPSFRVT